MKPYLITILLLASCVSPTITKTENEVKVKSGTVVRVVVTVHKDGSITTTSYPINMLEATISGLTGGLIKYAAYKADEQPQ